VTTAFVLTALGALLACGLEMLEALAIVLAVGTTRSWRDALLGAAGAVVVLAVAVVVVGPVVLGSLPLGVLKVVIGTALLLFGLEWLRKGVLRLAGRRSPSSSLREFLEEREAMEAVAAPEPGRADWPARVVAGKGVLLEGLEVVLIVAALGAGPDGLAPALAGAAAAVLGVLAIGALVHRPLARLPESHLKYAVGAVLSSFGVFFLGEGLGVGWPGGDAALLYILAALVATSQAQVIALARPDREAIA
jgi:Ca2+/H+ antiporter, TMEM165/GDT1 family